MNRSTNIEKINFHCFQFDEEAYEKCVSSCVSDVLLHTFPCFYLGLYIPDEIGQGLPGTYYPVDIASREKVIPWTWYPGERYPSFSISELISIVFTMFLPMCHFHKRISDIFENVD
jgi:hypothetical protein